MKCHHIKNINGGTCSDCGASLGCISMCINDPPLDPPIDLNHDLALQQRKIRAELIILCRNDGWIGELGISYDNNYSTAWNVCEILQRLYFILAGAK